MKLQRSLPLIVSTVMLLAACSKKDTSTPSTSYTEPSNTSRTQITIPAGLQTQASTNPNAAVAVSFMSLANGLSEYANDFTLPANAQKSNLKSNGTVYTWSANGYTVWMTYQNLSDRYTWTYDYQTPEIARFTLISADEMKANKQGSWTINSPDASHAVLWDYSWTLTGSVYNATMNYYGEAGTSGKFTILDNGNNSGSFQYYVGTAKEVDITWNTDGTGTWWFSNGTATASGSW
jgi:hypothetical protein